MRMGWGYAEIWSGILRRETYNTDKRIYQKNAENPAIWNWESKKISFWLSETEGAYIMSTKFNDFLQEQLQDPEFRKE